MRSMTRRIRRVGIRMKTRPRLPWALPPTWPLALGLLLGVLLTPSARSLCRWFASSGSLQTRGSIPSETSGLTEALRRCRQDLAQARARLTARRRDGTAWLRVASLEMHRANLIALRSYPGTEPEADAAAEPAGRSDFLWRQRFLRADPEGALSRAARAAECALRTDLDRPSRRRASLLLASARSALGDPLGEADALVAAVHREPDQARLWMLLAGAYRRAGRFAQAEAALRRADARTERRSTNL